ncbi:unnamed protein product [Heligmosomoides polygyrus]|uniref:HTH_48 domain-containing protein n=1 Tax=Heligmosomoides polygyrus TaxID=6339 RepID=A0A183FHF7_HELPZ|nr:unnamed protein product [Heligmosomoides polygyrus]
MASISQRDLRPVMFSEFLQHRSAGQAAANICAVSNENVVTRWTVFRGFKRFKDGDVSFEDAPRSGRLPAANDDA